MINRVMVTGAAGFIGSNLLEALLKNGNDVLGIDNFDAYYSREVKENNIKVAEINPKFVFRQGDLRDVGFLDKCFREFQPDSIIHLAAKAGVRPSLIDPLGYYDVNVTGTLNLLEIMRDYKVSRLIFASSSSVYGNNKKTPFAETDIVDFPISPYAATKKTGELLCHTYHHLYEFDIFCLRFFTVYGRRQRPDLAIHKFTKALFEGSPIPLYGTGMSKRDYTHIDDIIQGILNSLNLLKGYEIINLGESNTIILNDLITLLEKYTNRKANLNHLPMQAGDVEQTYADITKAREIINYNPKMSIEQGLAEFVLWYRQFNHL